MSLIQDLRYGARTLRKSPGFAVTAIVTLALGIGATTAVYSLADGMLWKPIPLPHMESLVTVMQADPNDPNDTNNASAADIDDIRRQASALDGLASWQFGLANIAGSGNEPERVWQSLVSANFFEVIGVQPAIGRAFVAGEDQPGREREVILSDGLWRRHYGGDAVIVGKAVRLDDQDFVVTGVMPPKYDFPMATELWTPMALTPEQRTSRREQSLSSVGRLKPGRSLPQAVAQVNGIATRLQKAYPDTNGNRRFAVWPIHRFLVDSETNAYVLMLLFAVVFVLLIACSNVANLQFARATGRLREVAVRTALGASRRRVIAQLVTESVLLSLAGAALGLLVASWGLDLIRNGMPAEIERFIVGWKDIRLDYRALTFTLAAAVASGILAGLAPAWQCSRPNLALALKEGGRGSSAGRSRHLLRNILVAGEVALALVLLVGAGLMVRGFGVLMQKGARLEPATLLTLRLALTDQKYHEPHQRIAFYREVIERIEAIPGVKSAAAATSLPFSDHSSGRDFTIEGRPVDPKDQPDCMYQQVTSRYFETVHVGLHEGRLIGDRDGPDAPPVVLVSKLLADRWWKHESPVGKHIKIGEADSKSPWMTIAGVVDDVVHSAYDRHPRRTIYVPFAQAPALWMDVVVRATGDPLRAASAVTAAIHSVDPEQPVTDMFTMEKAIHNRTIGLNYVRVMMGIFGVLALLLSAIGVYGVMAYLVSEQTHDIGIRLALGAPRQRVLGALFRRGSIVTAAGLIMGILPAWLLATKVMPSLVYGVSPTDPVTFVGIPLMLVAVAELAIYVPARRAMGIDPIVALRDE